MAPSPYINPRVWRAKLFVKTGPGIAHEVSNSDLDIMDKKAIFWSTFLKRTTPCSGIGVELGSTKRIYSSGLTLIPSYASLRSCSRSSVQSPMRTDLTVYWSVP